MDHMEEKILSIIDSHAQELQALADDLFQHPEQGYHEYRTAKVVADFLRKLGPKEGLAITGVKASIGKEGGPNLALIGELDALACPTHPSASPEGYAHACGHYAQLVCMLGAALALSDPEVAASLDGKATFFAVPAEEFQGAAVREEVLREHDVHCIGGKCELLRRGGVDVIQPDLSRCGGLSVARKLTDMARMHKVTIVPHAFKTNILMAATLQYIASLPDAWYLEFCEQDTPLRQTLTQPVFQVDGDGFVEISQKPGLGIDLDWDVFDYYRVK